ncbi:hypothetical protein D3C78_1677560 [compost metagenome]
MPGPLNQAQCRVLLLRQHRRRFRWRDPIAVTAPHLQRAAVLRQIAADIVVGQHPGGIEKPLGIQLLHAVAYPGNILRIRTFTQ